MTEPRIADLMSVRPGRADTLGDDEVSGVMTNGPPASTTSARGRMTGAGRTRAEGLRRWRAPDPPS